MAPSPISEPAPSPLPQYGLGPEVDFQTLVKNNRFLYRVYTPKERSPFADESDPFLVAPKFDELYARTPVEVTSARIINPTDAPYSEIARHMDWTTRSSSLYLSTSFSFAWSIWEALRRYHQGMKKDVEIAVIDAYALAERAATAVQMLNKSTPEERGSQFNKWMKFSQESQSVLIYGFIPGSAVLSSVPLLPLLERLPSYFLRTKSRVIQSNPLDHVAWDYRDKRQTYRQFCQDMSTRFFNISQELRFRDATGGSLRLALTFLRPWFHKMIVQDFNLSVSTLRDLAIIIAHWGGQWWARDHAELNRILDSMTFTLGEELLQRTMRQDLESSKLQDTVETLERIIRVHETERLSQPSPIAMESCQCASSPITPQGSPKIRHKRTMSMTNSFPHRTDQSIQSPILPLTPPDSRRNSWAVPNESPTRTGPRTVFQPFTPPAEWVMPRKRALSLNRSTPSLMTDSTLSFTPLAHSTLLSPAVEVDESLVSPLNDQEQSHPEVPRTPPTKGLAFSEAAALYATPPSESAVKPPSTSDDAEGGQEITIHPISTPSALPTPPLEPVERAGAHTPSSEVSSGLRIFIPAAPTHVAFPPSPAERAHTPYSPHSESPNVSDAATPSPLATETDLLSKSGSGLLEPCGLGSPIRLVNFNDAAELPPLPTSASSSISWGSRVSTLSPNSPPVTPPARATSSKWASSVKPRWSPPKSSGTIAESPVTPVDPSPIVTCTSSRSSLSDDAVRSPVADSPDSMHHRVVPAASRSPRFQPAAEIKPKAHLTDGVLEFIGYRRTTPRTRSDTKPNGVKNVPVSHSDNEDLDDDDDDERLNDSREAFLYRHGPILDTASTVVTGFLIGAFITLVMVSGQRRTLLVCT